MIKCQTCGTQNLDSSQFCDECGDSLQKYVAPEASEVPANDISNSESQSQDVPVFQSASVTSIGVPSIDEEKVSVPEAPADKSEDNRKTSVQNVQDLVPKDDAKKIIHAKLIIERGQSIGAEFTLTTGESNIGRWDADNGIFPDVDLDAHDTEAKVSRKHARIHLNNGQYMLEDLGSTNGTFINRGRRLLPGSPHVLNDGDEIIVGKTFLRFQIVN